MMITAKQRTSAGGYRLICGIDVFDKSLQKIEYADEQAEEAIDKREKRRGTVANLAHSTTGFNRLAQYLIRQCGVYPHAHCHYGYKDGWRTIFVGDRVFVARKMKIYEYDFGIEEGKKVLTRVRRRRHIGADRG
jgi:hypothetical protein